jgi:hypothetical protein
MSPRSYSSPFVAALLVAAWLSLWFTGKAGGDEPPAARRRSNPQRLMQRIAELERRIEQLERELDEAHEARSVEENSPTPRRFQLVKAGGRLIVFDGDTGETRVIEPAGGRPLQNVEIGKALVVVTVLGAVKSETESKASSGDAESTASESPLAASSQRSKEAKKPRSHPSP